MDRFSRRTQIRFSELLFFSCCCYFSAIIILLSYYYCSSFYCYYCIPIITLFSLLVFSNSRHLRNQLVFQQGEGDHPGPSVDTQPL
jgi:hypothetical protein